MKILRFIDDKLEEILGIVGLAVMVVLIFLQVICRYVLHAALPWSEEIARFLFLWVIWLGASHATKERKHIRLDVVTSRLKGMTRTIIQGLAYVIWLLFMCILSILSLQLTLNIFNLNQVSTAAGVPMWIAYASVTVGAILCVFRLIQNVIIDQMKKRRRENA
ncbi:MAG: TRAP transporter small permease [Firmicutes bacterium]|nr:TRAP transporter small permease [Bacillota bacterium]